MLLLMLQGTMCSLVRLLVHGCISHLHLFPAVSAVRWISLQFSWGGGMLCVPGTVGWCLCRNTLSNTLFRSLYIGGWVADGMPTDTEGVGLGYRCPVRAWLESVPGLFHCTCVSSIACVGNCLCLRTKQGTSGAPFFVRHKDGIVPTLIHAHACRTMRQSLCCCARG
jgi:hypothetical protein